MGAEVIGREPCLVSHWLLLGSFLFVPECILQVWCYVTTRRHCYSPGSLIHKPTPPQWYSWGCRFLVHIGHCLLKSDIT